jgi:hypothetical protein
MANDPSQTGKASSFFGSDLDLHQQREQLLKFIADYSERMRRLEDGEEKELVSRRLDFLTEGLAQIDLSLTVSS